MLPGQELQNSNFCGRAIDVKVQIDRGVRKSEPSKLWGRECCSSMAGDLFSAPPSAAGGGASCYKATSAYMVACFQHG